jgi:TonB family protein
VIRIASIAALIVFSQVAIGQQPPGDASTAPSPQVVITRLLNPPYPPLARQARITGDVELSVAIRRDGSIRSVSVVSGHPMLREAAAASAQGSEFECRGCAEQGVQYRLLYKFREVEAQDCCTVWNEPASIILQPALLQAAEETEVIVEVLRGCLCDPTETISWIKVRSAKCLYLWKCSKRYPA